MAGVISKSSKSCSNFIKAIENLLLIRSKKKYNFFSLNIHEYMMYTKAKYSVEERLHELPIVE